VGIKRYPSKSNVQKVLERWRIDWIGSCQTKEKGRTRTALHETSRFCFSPCLKLVDIWSNGRVWALPPQRQTSPIISAYLQRMRSHTFLQARTLAGKPGIRYVCYLGSEVVSPLHKLSKTCQVAWPWRPLFGGFPSPPRMASRIIKIITTRITVIFNFSAHGRKLADFRLFCSTPTKKSCRTARNCHFALHHHAINFHWLSLS